MYYDLSDIVSRILINKSVNKSINPSGKQIFFTLSFHHYFVSPFLSYCLPYFSFSFPFCLDHYFVCAKKKKLHNYKNKYFSSVIFSLFCLPNKRIFVQVLLVSLKNKIYKCTPGIYNNVYTYINIYIFVIWGENNQFKYIVKYI